MQECKKCGTCCEKSGPTLHIEDKYLVSKGVLPPSNLVTLRIGEMVYDPREEKHVPLENEIIKISGKDSDWECLFYENQEKTCSIYKTRPVECRLLKCWDTKPVLSIMNKNLLSREMLFGKIEGLYDLVKDHDEKCSHIKLKELLLEFEKDNTTETLEKLKEIILYDINIREIVREKQKAAGAMENLLFGRPFTKTIEQFRYKIQYSKDKGLKIMPFKLDKILQGTIS